MTDRIEIDPRRLLGIRITVSASATTTEARREALTAAKVGEKVGTKGGQKPT
jgi:hypothetical protein